GTTSLAVNGGSVTGNGTINLTNGTFTLTGNGSLGGNTAWTFSSLTLGNGATVASTTKAGTGNITASGVVTVSLNHNLIAGGVTWSLTGGGTPLVLSGGIVPATSSFKYAGNSNTFVTPATYYRLELSPAAAGTPTYTLQSGNFVVRENMYVGDGINAVNATAATNNNSLDVAGDFTIRASGNYSAASSSLFAVGGSWSNSGVFAHSNGTLTLDSTSTGRTIAPGNSSFYNLTLNSTTGGWTISGNATTTGDFSLASASSFTLNSGVTLEARGLFTNSVGGASTTWTGSTLNINNGTSSMLNTKVAGADAYGTLRVSANADVKMWYSSATAYNVDSSGSLYSMDNGNIDGSLFIWGDYHISTGTTEYWNYQTDFDGVNLGASPRIAAVRLASSSVVTVDGGSLNIVGLSTATSTLANQGSGAYALRIYGGAFNGNYYQIKNTDANGLDLQGTPAITSLNNGDYELSVVGGSLIKLAASVINANPGKTVSGCRFATSSGVSSGYNVNLSGTPGQEWTFTGLLGSIAGEAYDFDPGDPRGYIVWDDSPIYLPVSKSWRFYHDENDETPTTPAAGERVSPSDIPAGNKIKLRLAVRESNGVSGMNVKMRLQYSTMPDFSSDVNYVGEIGSTSALWTFADGVDADNAAITALLLASTTVKATHNEIGSSTSTFLHPASTTAEWEFTIFNNAAAVGTTYYFRAYSVQYRDKAVLRDSGESYPSLVASGGSLGTALSGVTSGTSVDGVITNISTGPNTISFGTVPIGTSMAGAQRLQINTNAESGYQLFLYEDQDMINDRGDTITPVAATNDSPAAWPGLGFGYHTSDDTLSGLAPSRFAANDSYAKLENGMKEIGYNPLPTVSESIDLLYRLQISAQQQPGSYTAQVVYIVVPTY
ncbi:hypothetical protein HGA64_00535, partial [Candidatus Falkowbacteria bacterium]|nr:hypothetical protein [Candidatus Falkowbacteria bacterium]